MSTSGSRDNAASAVSEALGDALGGVSGSSSRGTRAQNTKSTGGAGSATRTTEAHQRQYQQPGAPTLGRLPIPNTTRSNATTARGGASGSSPATAYIGRRSGAPASVHSSKALAGAYERRKSISRPSTGSDSTLSSRSDARGAALGSVAIDIPSLLSSSQQHRNDVSPAKWHREGSTGASTTAMPSLAPSPFRSADHIGFRRLGSNQKSPPRGGTAVETNASTELTGSRPRTPSPTKSSRPVHAVPAPRSSAQPTSPASAIIRSTTAAAVHMASAFLRRKQPYLESDVIGADRTNSSEHPHALAANARSSAAATRLFFQDESDAASECESHMSQSHLSASSSVLSASLPESSSVSGADKQVLRPATRKDSTSTRPRHKSRAAAKAAARSERGGVSASGDRGSGDDDSIGIERIGELSREEDEFDFALLLKPSKYEELLDLPQSPSKQQQRRQSSNATATRSMLHSSATGVAFGSARSATESNWRSTLALSQTHTQLRAPSAKQDPARARNLIIARIQQTGLHVKRLLSLDGKQTLLKVKAPPHVLELGAERLRLRKLRQFDRIWIEFSRELRTTFMDFDVASQSVRFIDSEKQSIVHALLTSDGDDGSGSGTCGAGLNEFSALKVKYVLHMFPLHKQDLGSLKTHWVTYWRTPPSSPLQTALPIATTSAETEAGGAPASMDDSARHRYCCSRLVCDVLTQPIDDVAQYFGEKVAFYFAWMEMYTRWLVVPSIVGLALFALQVKSKTLDHPLAPLYAISMALWSSAFLVAWRRRAAALAYRWGTLGYEEDVEVTRPEFYGDPAISTPACKRYPVWRRCVKYAVTLPTVLGSMALTLAITYWAFSTRDRLEHESLAAKARAKDVAQDIAADLAHGLTLENLKRLSALGLDWHFWFYFLVTPMLYGLLIPVLDHVFTKGARRMTHWENHRTESQHRSHLILKVFSFRFVHVFASLYYYAFSDVPAESRATATTAAPTAGDSADDAPRADNLLRVSIQLASFMVAGQLWKNVMETLVPFVRRRWRGQQKKRDTNTQFNQSAVFNATGVGLDAASGSGGASSNRAGMRRRGHDAAALAARSRAAPGAAMNTNALIHEQCVRLEQASDKAWEEAELQPYDTFEDYTEMLIQFGYVSFFSLAFPLAPLLALLNNVFELRTDAFKLCHTKQRPLAHKASGIGIWFHVLQLMSALAVLTNCLHVAFTTSLLERLAPASYAGAASGTTKVWLAFGAEHTLLALQVAVMVAVPAMPRDVQDKVRVEREQARLESARAMAAKVRQLCDQYDDPIGDIDGNNDDDSIDLRAAAAVAAPLQDRLTTIHIVKPANDK